MTLEDSTTSKHKRKVGHEVDQFPGPAPIPKSATLPHIRGVREKTNGIKNLKLKGHMKLTENKYTNAVNQAARSELLLTEESGFLEVEEGEDSCDIRQSDIVKEVDITSASKHFNLNLTLGPYRCDYTRNGRHLLLGGRMGHLSAFDWISKKLLCEINTMEAITDVQWLHSESMFAVAQKKWTYIYDNQGVELHCIKQLNDTLQLDYLPYHFLLTSINNRGFLQYLDVSMGKIISTINTKCGRSDVLTHNPYNAISILGHHNGTVTMWSPNQKESVVKMLCHKNAIRSICVDKQGNYLVTSGQDRHMKIFDIRTLKPLHSYRLSYGASNLHFSQRGLLAASCQNVVEIYKDPCLELQEKPYLTHTLRKPASDLRFCPYEDILGVASSEGFVSLLVPGAGEANYDGFESNPNRSKAQRREWEVKALLEKIPADLISLDPFSITKVDRVTAKQLQQDREERLGPMEPKKFKPKHKKKGKSKSGNIENRKNKVKETAKREEIRESIEEKEKQSKAEEKKRKRKMEQIKSTQVSIPSVSTNESSTPSNEMADSAPKPPVIEVIPKKRTALDRFKK